MAVRLVLKTKSLVNESSQDTWIALNDTWIYRRFSSILTSNFSTVLKIHSSRKKDTTRWWWDVMYYHEFFKCMDLFVENRFFAHLRCFLFLHSHQLVKSALHQMSVHLESNYFLRSLYSIFLQNSDGYIYIMSKIFQFLKC